ncbi:MAG: DUF3368 domain-containing protein [Treponema sp.]|jgi:predicted nucleic acid-binding protein|nr:DUF3368 domain-containing protein [Treponema sp.]
MPGRQGSIVISDTSCLIGLANIGRLDVLKQLYGEVIVTPEIAGEYALALPEWITTRKVKDKNTIIALNAFIDLGESSAIALAAELEDVLLIVDDRRARKVAIDLGLAITGTLGILIRAYEQGVIDDINSAIADLRRVHFRIPDNAESLVKNLLKK